MDNHDVAEFLFYLMTSFLVVIFVYILSSWLPRRPVTGPFKVILDFCEQTAEPYIGIFRRVIRPVGGGQFQLDLSPMVATIVLLVVGNIIIGAVENF